MLAGGVVVQDDMNLLVFRHPTLGLAQEAQYLLVAMLAIRLAEHLAGRDAQRREQRGRAVALLIMRHRRTASLLHRQTRLRPVQHLYLALLGA